MLSLTGSLLADPSKPQVLPEGAAATRFASMSPDLPEPPAKIARTAPAPRKSFQGQAKATPSKATPTKVVAPAAPEIDESQLSARDLKKLRKEQEKAKRDARKARKEGGDNDEAPASLKRKADEDEEGTRKKHKE